MYSRPYQFPSGMTMSAGLRQEACQPSSHLSQSKIHSGWSEVAHFLQAKSTTASSSSSASLEIGDSADAAFFAPFLPAAFLVRFFLLAPVRACWGKKTKFIKVWYTGCLNSGLVQFLDTPKCCLKSGLVRFLDTPKCYLKSGRQKIGC